MIIVGTQPSTSTVAKGTFFCPQCQAERGYRRRRVKQTLSFFFVPVIPFAEVAQYIECNQCGGTFKLEVLDYRPGLTSEEIKAEYKKAILAVMVLMMSTDGRILPSEITGVQKGYEAIVGVHLSEQEIRRKADELSSQETPILEYMRALGAFLNESGKEQVLRAAIFAAGADDLLAASEMKLVNDIGRALELTPAHIKGVFQEMMDLSDDPPKYE